MYSNLFNFFSLFAVVVAAKANANVVSEQNVRDHFWSSVTKAAKAADLFEVETHSISAQANLRMVNEEARFLQGYAFLAEYSGTTCADSDFKRLRIVQLNTCIPANDHRGSRKYRAWKTVKGNFALTENMWDDDQCRDGWKKDDKYLPYDTCFYGYKAWAGPMSENPPAYITGSVGFFEIPNNQVCLDSRDLVKDFAAAEFQRIGNCIENDSDESDPGRDTMITSCSDDAGVQMQRYNSKDGTCTSGSYSVVYNPKNLCVWYDIHWDLNFGWTKYGCF